MPVTRSAEKKVRKDKSRTKLNKNRKLDLKSLLKKAKTNPTAENLRKAQSAVDKLVKVKLLHRNKGSRLKSQLAKLTKNKTKQAADEKSKIPSSPRLRWVNKNKKSKIQIKSNRS